MSFTTNPIQYCCTPLKEGEERIMSKEKGFVDPVIQFPTEEKKKGENA